MALECTFGALENLDQTDPDAVQALLDACTKALLTPSLWYWAIGLTIACALDPTADDLDQELDRLAEKIDAGAHVIMTQPIYAREQWDALMDRAAARWPMPRWNCRRRNIPPVA